ncbi:hypothetical protein [Sphingomonas sp. Leaf30]|uniref:hypothetical protein n=1 Tax=Sphingomonas sp. Leaf30 TaxID=1736213 RepID=UPI0006F8BE08|nr:hypothetical protein [Sphingomonas sp. Leaf30]KQN11577.1 hypothetical protein ASE89_14435 [Sphingomonas sp. Leaf30]
MPDDKPLGWRPFTEEDRARQRAIGYDEETIDELELSNVYSPNEHAIWAVELGVAMLHAAGRRHGPDFARDVLSALQSRAKRLSGSESSDDRVEGAMVANLVATMDWDAVIARASNPDWSAEAD